MDVVVSVTIHVSGLDASGAVPEALRPAIPAAVQAAVAAELRCGEQHGFCHPLEDAITLHVQEVTAITP